jgi:chromosomal replication initiation ATPase DnaA
MINKLKIHPQTYLGLDFVTIKNKQFILETVCSKLRINKELILSKTRVLEVVYARAIVCNELRKLQFTLKEIGKFIGKDHSSIIYYEKLLANKKYIPKLEEMYNKIND